MAGIWRSSAITIRCRKCLDKSTRCVRKDMQLYWPAGKDGLKRIGIHTERIKYWLSVGAQPSDTVARLLFLVGILPKPPVSHVSRKGPPPARPAPPPADAEPK